MKTASLKQIKVELENLPPKDVIEICLRLSKFKKENKELLTYLLYEESNEKSFIEGVKKEMEAEFVMMNTDSYYFIKKSVRKILRTVKKYIRYSKKKETEVELLIHFCRELKKMEPSIFGNTTITNLFERTLESIRKKLASLHEDLQYDFNMELEEIWK